MCGIDISTLFFFFFPNTSFSIFFRRGNQLTHIICQYILHTEKLGYLAFSCVKISQASRFLSTSLKMIFRKQSTHINCVRLTV